MINFAEEVLKFTQYFIMSLRQVEFSYWKLSQLQNRISRNSHPVAETSVSHYIESVASRVQSLELDSAAAQNQL